MRNEIKKLLVIPEVSVKDAMRQMDRTGKKYLLVINNEKQLIGIISDGDIRRHILARGHIEGTIESCYNKNPISLLKTVKIDIAKKLMIEKKIEVIPVLNEENRCVDLYVWSELFNRRQPRKKIINIPVVIMAGGKGKRLDPFTKILPKPLIPIGEKPIIEVIMEKFSHFGIKEFFVTLNYKGGMIKSYFENVKLDYNLKFIWEKEFYGTAGSLKLLPKNFASTFIISNCDIIVEADYNDLINYHKNGNYDLTVVGSIQHHIIPYGVIQFSINGNVKKITEKPEYDLTINTGLYVMEKTCLPFIPKNQSFHITQLIERLMQEEKKIGLYPVSEKSYIDIGQWEEYRRNIQKIIV